MVKRQRHRTAHEMTIVNLGKILAREYPGDDVWVNTKHRREKRPIPGTNFWPDALNFSKQIAYEVHWAGNRKENQRDHYPPGWQLINVYITDIWEREAYVFNLDGHYVHITEQYWKPITR